MANGENIYKKIFGGSFLTSREKQILSLRMRGKTLDFIGGKLGITRERVRQIGVKIQDKLRANLWEEDLVAYRKAFYGLRERRKLLRQGIKFKVRTSTLKIRGHFRRTK